MTTDQISEFVMLAEQRNYLIAADNMFMTQSTLSRHIMALEEELGYPLFSRTTKRIELTAEGAHFLIFARDVVRLRSSYESAIRKAKAANEGSLRIAYNYLISIYETNILINRFVSDNPNYKIAVSEDEPASLVESVRNGLCDIAVFQEDPFNRVHGLDVVRLNTDTLVCIASKKGKYANLTKCGVETFRNDLFVTSDPDRPPMVSLYETCRRSGFEPKIAKTGFVGSMSFSWIAKHPEYLALDLKKPTLETADPSLFSIIDIEPVLNYHTVLVYNKETISQLGKQFIRYMQKHSKEQHNEA